MKTDNTLGNMVHPAGVEPATSGLGNHCATSKLMQSGAFSLDSVPVLPHDSKAAEPLSVQGVRRSNGMTGERLTSATRPPAPAA